MASILEFRKSADQLNTSASRDVRGPAEIVLFPGIRYERMEEPCDAVANDKPSRKSRSRDRIDLDS